MSGAIETSLPASLAAQSRSRQRSFGNAIEFVLAALACTAICLWLNAVMGRDVNWDYVNYHGYAALSALQNRVGQDFWAAGVQAYLNPLPFLPFALMQKAGWSSLAIASALATFQSLGLLALYGLSRHLASGLDRPRLAAALMTALGAASPVFFSQIGSTFVDATTAPLIMVGLWVLVARTGVGAVCAAAALAGAAMALKWTNAPFAMGILVAAVLAVPAQSLAQRVRLALWASGALLLGFGLLYGWWGWRLWQEHGSPVFPLFNSIFLSPDAPTQSVSYMRFVPQTWSELATFPFRMALHEGWVHTEVVSPDLRPALLTILLAVLGLRVGLQGAGHVSAPTAPPSHSMWRVPIIFFAVSFAGWLATSSNGRYAVPLFLLHGPLLWHLLHRLMGERRAFVLTTLIALLQVMHAAEAGSPRWNARPWTQDWLAVDVPDSLRREPMLFVLIGRPSGSFLASGVHRDSVFVNPIGTVSLVSDGPGWARFETVRERFSGRTRVVMSVNAAFNPAELRARLERQNLVIDRLGLRINVEACDLIPLDDQASLIPWLGPEKGELTDNLVVCQALRVTPDPVLAESRASAARIMDAFEERCPRIFSPRPTQVEGSGALWTRAYGRYDVYLTIDPGAGWISYRSDRQIGTEYIGTVASWPADAARFRCVLPLNGRRGIETLALNPDAPR